jgi:hypothetical protein
MPERLPDHPRLHALLGAAVLDLPAALAETLEDALRESAEFVTPSAFFAHLKGHGRNLRADGEAWSEMCLSPGRAFDMALATRSVSGITALTAVLHAAHGTGERRSCLLSLRRRGRRSVQRLPGAVAAGGTLPGAVKGCDAVPVPLTPGSL